MWTHPDTSSTTFHHCVRYSGSWRIDHWDEASKAQSWRGEIHVIAVKPIATRKVFLIQIEMAETWKAGGEDGWKTHKEAIYCVSQWISLCTNNKRQLSHNSQLTLSYSIFLKKNRNPHGKCSLTQNSFSQSSQVHVSCLERFFPLLIQRQLLAFYQNGRAALQYTFWCSLHHQQVAQVQGILQFMNRQLEGRGIVDRGSIKLDINLCSHIHCESNYQSRIL